MKQYLPSLLRHWLEAITPFGQVALILLAAWLLRALVRRLLDRLCKGRDLAPEVALVARRVAGFLIFTTAILIALGRLGVSGTVLWTAFTGFAAVGAVAFFAGWSVLSNMFSAVLIMTARPFRLLDHIEILENGDKPGLKGRVIDVNLIYTTLQEQHETGAETILRVPNSLFFQRIVRRWRGEPLPLRFEPPVEHPPTK